MTTRPSRYRRNRSHRAVAALEAITIAAGIASTAAHAFDDAAGSKVDYRIPQAAPAVSCASVVSHTDHDITIVSAAIANAGDENEHCRVDGYIRPEIRFRLELPTRWNGRFVMFGGGGYAGHQPSDEVSAALLNGFATAATDTGHNAALKPLATFALNDKAAEIDYAYRAVHLTASTAKRVIGLYYDRRPANNYWLGCSTGGRQGLMSAQRFPADFDGIVAGAPVLDFTGTQTSGVWAARAMREAPVSLEKIRGVGESIYARCDASDGLEDGLIEDPRACDFDVRRDHPRCGDDSAQASASDCLTAAEANTMAKIYDGVVSNGKRIFPGQPVGAELGDPASGANFATSGWGLWYVNPTDPSKPSLLELFGMTFMRYMAFERDDPERTLDDIDFDRDPGRMDGIRAILDATNPDLQPFKERGGKMITYHGWADTALNPMMAIDYYESVLERDPQAADFYRLFMVPGMYHCAGGLGVSGMDIITPLVEWVEAGIEPERIIGYRRDADGNETLSRPLCPYPKAARHDGRGDANRHDSFDCTLP